MDPGQERPSNCYHSPHFVNLPHPSSADGSSPARHQDLANVHRGSFHQELNQYLSSVDIFEKTWYYGKRLTSKSLTANESLYASPRDPSTPHDDELSARLTPNGTVDYSLDQQRASPGLNPVTSYSNPATPCSADQSAAELSIMSASSGVFSATVSDYEVDSRPVSPAEYMEDSLLSEARNDISPHLKEASPDPSLAALVNANWPIQQPNFKSETPSTVQSGNSLTFTNLQSAHGEVMKEKVKDTRGNMSPGSVSDTEAVTSSSQKVAKTCKKPTETYIELIARAILASPNKKLILADIYGFILANYPYYRSAESTWRNAIRHNLSVNECFIKNGRSNVGRGYHWSIHPACLKMFEGGQFQRREARRLVQQMSKVQQKKSEEERLMREALAADMLASPAYSYPPGYAVMTQVPTQNQVSDFSTPERCFPYYPGAHPQTYGGYGSLYWPGFAQHPFATSQGYYSYPQNGSAYASIPMPSYPYLPVTSVTSMSPYQESCTTSTAATTQPHKSQQGRPLVGEYTGQQAMSKFCD